MEENLELSFVNLLYNSKSLEKPRGTVADSKKNSFPLEEELKKDIPDFDEHYKIRYNANGGYAYGGISEEDKEKKIIIAITKVGDDYKYRLFKEVNEKETMVGKSWSSSKDEFDYIKTLKENLNAQ